MPDPALERLDVPADHLQHIIEIVSLQLTDLAVQIVDDLLRIFDAGALLPRTNNSPARFTSSCFQLLIIVG
jgi:hypothetical protein